MLGVLSELQVLFLSDFVILTKNYQNKFTLGFYTERYQVSCIIIWGFYAQNLLSQSISSK